MEEGTARQSDALAPVRFRGRTKVGNLQDASPVEENVGDLEVAVQDLVDGKVVQAAEELLCQALDLRHGKLDVLVEEAAQVVVHKLKDEVHVALEAVVFRRWGWSKEGGARQAARVSNGVWRTWANVGDTADAEARGATRRIKVGPAPNVRGLCTTSRSRSTLSWLTEAMSLISRTEVMGNWKRRAERGRRERGCASQRASAGLGRGAGKERWQRADG